MLPIRRHTKIRKQPAIRRMGAKGSMVGHAPPEPDMVNTRPWSYAAYEDSTYNVLYDTTNGPMPP